MGLETASYINQLNPSNPLSTDGLGATDDHIRLLKAVLKSTFPNITGPITVDQNKLNSPIPIGVITLWYGAEAEVPAGWAICDGRTVTRTDGGGPITTPNLVHRFPIGAGPDFPKGSIGGTTGPYTTTAAGGITTTLTTTVAGQHSHGGRTHGHSITIGQMPKHRHGTAGPGGGGSEFIRTDGNGWGNSNNYLLMLDGGGVQLYSTYDGNNEPHDHGLNADGNHSHTASLNVATHQHTVSGVIPPYLALHFIMKY